MQRQTGRFERTVAGGEHVDAFVPFPLPPTNPPFAVDEERLRCAEEAIGRLIVAGVMVPSLEWFSYAFVRKEAVVSSQIEGTQATLVDLFAFEADDNPAAASADVEEVCNYVDAVGYARGELADENGLPLSLRLLHTAHARLMNGVRGVDKQPGEVRRSQNWIGGSRPGNAVFVPPPPHLVPELLSSLESWFHVDDCLPPLVRVALAHAQFETIHPYLDGNGRIGRLLIALLLEHWQVLPQPLLYLSLFLKRHRDEYYRLLGEVRRSGDFEAFVDFFLDGVKQTADEATHTAQQLFALMTTDRARVLASDDASVIALRLFEHLPRRPILTAANAATILDVSRPTATRALQTLAACGVLEETSGKRRDRSWAWSSYLAILRVGTDDPLR